jgi:hypothetical protein
VLATLVTALLLLAWLLSAALLLAGLLSATLLLATLLLAALLLLTRLLVWILVHRFVLSDVASGRINRFAPMATGNALDSLIVPYRRCKQASPNVSGTRMRPACSLQQ